MQKRGRNKSDTKSSRPIRPMISLPLPKGKKVKMMAPCPFRAADDSEEHKTKTCTGSGKDADGRDYYKYNCEKCKRIWRQIRIDQLRPGEVPETVEKTQARKQESQHTVGRNSSHVCQLFHHVRRQYPRMAASSAQ